MKVQESIKSVKPETGVKTRKCGRRKREEISRKKGSSGRGKKKGYVLIRKGFIKTVRENECIKN